MEPPDQPGRDERWYLTDERDFLRRSLEDAAREHEAGDLSDEDHALLVARDSARLAEVEAELAALGPAEPAPAPDAAAEPARRPRPPETRRPMPRVAPGRDRGRRCLLIVAGGVILVAHFVQARQPGPGLVGQRHPVRRPS